MSQIMFIIILFQIISITLADGPSNPPSSAATGQRTTLSTSTSRVESTVVKTEDRDVTSAVASRLPSSTAISAVSYTHLTLPTKA